MMLVSHVWHTKCRDGGMSTRPHNCVRIGSVTRVENDKSQKPRKSHCKSTMPHLVFVVSVTSLQQRLIDTSAAGDNADHGAHIRFDDLLRARRQSEARGAVVAIVGDNGGVGARALGNLAAVAGSGLHVADNGTYGNIKEWKTSQEQVNAV